MQYRFEVTDPQADTWEVALPPGFEYVGLAPGSQVGAEPEVSQDGTWLTWHGPFPLGHEVRFWIAPVKPTEAPASLSVVDADAEAQLVEPLRHLPAGREGTPPAPASVDAVSVAKSVDPDKLLPADSRWVTYEVVFTNTYTQPITLDRVTDTLPVDFDFGGMAYGSEVGEPADAGEPEIVWESVVVTGSGTVTLRYNVRALEAPGEYQNRVEAATGAGLVGPASAELQVSSGKIYIPLALQNYEAPSQGIELPYIEDFTYSALEGWEHFTNWPDLSADRWYWAGDEGVWGIYNYEYDLVQPENTGYSLFLFNADGAQEWTDYRIEASLKDVKEENQKKGLSGIWFRGNYENSGALDGKMVGGYYVYMKPGDDHLYLMRTPTDNPTFGAHQVVADYYYGPLIGHKHWYDFAIEVEGPHIEVWFGDAEAGMVKAFDWTDPLDAWPQGTVGLSVYNTSTRFDYVYVLAND